MKRNRLTVLVLWPILTLALLSGLLAFTRRAYTTNTTSSTATGGQNTDPLTPQIEPKLEDRLLAAVERNADDGLIRIIIEVRSDPESEASRANALQEQSRDALVRQLRQIAQQDQASLIAELALLQEAQLVANIRPFWIANLISAAGTATAILQLQKHPDVSRVRLDSPFPLTEPITETVEMSWLSEQKGAPADPLSWGVERVKAHYVWNALGVDGRGATVAIMDTGVDWRHPDLFPNYRGNLGGGSVNHSFNWYDTSTLTRTEPYDLLGHGTHVAGTAVGQNGIGVAPGAKWIAVNIATSDGYIYESDVHAGFQWLMAPDGDPAMAPDVVNCSWGGNPADTSFVDDIDALNAAGIIPVFAAGNSGPFPQSIESPGSNPGTLAVGASGDIDDVSWFSSRGPSIQAADLKPWLVAPGNEILSAIPGNRRGYGTGTSMSAPHVAGAIALLKSANAALRFPEIKQILADSSAPIDSVHPNFNSGWGLLDTFAAVSSQIQTGRLSGQITSDGIPLPYTAIQLIGWNGSTLAFTSDTYGRFQIDVSQGIYGLRINAFGYQTSEEDGILVTRGQTSRHDFELSPMPLGTVQGVVLDSSTGTHLQTVIEIPGTPITASSGIDGGYALALPQGQYQIAIRANGYRLDQRSIEVTADQTINVDFELTPAPTILLVDSGKWYNGSAIHLYQQALTALDYNHDQWAIRDPYFGVPGDGDLAAYDVVVWSSPLDSPGLVGANDIITGYLGSGGTLLISGQHVGRFDGYGFDTQWWWYRSLKAQFQGGASAAQRFSGRPDTLFEGIDFTLNGGTSASNQIDVDVSRPRPGSLTTELFAGEDGSAVALQASACEPFRMVYLGFGLEGVTQAEDRTAILNAAMGQLQAPRRSAGILWTPEEINDFAVAGSDLTYTITVRNLSETLTDTLQLELSSESWVSDIVTSSLELGPCQQGQTVLHISVPENAPKDASHLTTITARSSNSATVSADLLLALKLPGDILLVDDDRWYNQELVYQEALDGLGIAYDYWEIGWDQNKRGSPSSELLNAYDIVLWFTAYDWFKPVTDEENRLLMNYLDQGGRLFLTSQDFLYYHHATPLARQYIGVVEYQESITPTVIYGRNEPGSLFQLDLPQPLEFGMYQNFSDGLVPSDSSRAVLWNDRGMASAVTNADEDWRLIFMGFPFEKLPPSSRQDMLMQITGWLGDLGESTITADRRSVAPGVAIDYTISAVNSAMQTNVVTLTNLVPAGLRVLTETISGDAQFDASSKQLVWHGILKGHEIHTISYQAVPASNLESGSRLENRVYFSYQRLPVRFAQVDTVWSGAPDLSGSSLSASAGRPDAQQTITYTLELRNKGVSSSEPVSASIRLPAILTPISATLFSSSGMSRLQDGHVFWRGVVPAGKPITVSIAMSRAVSLTPAFVPAVALIEDNVSAPILRYVQPRLSPFQTLLPVIGKE